MFPHARAPIPATFAPRHGVLVMSSFRIPGLSQPQFRPRRAQVILTTGQDR